MLFHDCRRPVTALEEKLCSWEGQDSWSALFETAAVPFERGCSDALQWQWHGSRVMGLCGVAKSCFHVIVDQRRLPGLRNVDAWNGVQPQRDQWSLRNSSVALRIVVTVLCCFSQAGPYCALSTD